MKLHKISIAAAILAVIAMAGCRKEMQTGRQPVSSSVATISSDYSSNTDNTSTAADEPTISKEESENVTASSEVSSRISTVVSAKTVSSKRSEPPKVSSLPKPPVTSSGTSSVGKTSSAQESTKPEPPKEKDPYAYPFDIEKIKADLIKYGESLGMKHRTHYSDGTEVTPDGASYELPMYIEEGYPNGVIRKRMYQQLDSYRNVYKAEVFTIYIQSYGNSEYQIYSIYA